MANDLESLLASLYASTQQPNDPFTSEGIDNTIIPTDWNDITFIKIRTDKWVPFKGLPLRMQLMPAKYL